MYPRQNGICRPDIPYPQVSHESVPSLIDNLTSALYGTISKSVVNGRIVWNIPCDPQNTYSVSWLPRNPGEGTLCYILRLFNTILWDTPGNITVTNLTVTSTISLPAGSITSASLAPGSITPNLLSTGAPTWNTSGVLTATSFSGPLSGNATSATTATSASTANIATYLAGGNAGYLPYQTQPGQTAMLAAGTSGYVLTSGGTSAPTWSNSAIAKAYANISATAVVSNSFGSVTASVTSNVFTVSSAAITSSSIILVTQQAPTGGGYAPVVVPGTGSCTVRLFSGSTLTAEPFSILIF